MTPSLKKEAILSLAAALGRLAADNVGTLDLTDIEKQMILDNAKDLYAVGLDAVKKCCYAKPDKSYLRRIERKIQEACSMGDGFDFTLIISMLFAGLQDLELYCKEKDILAGVSDAALNLMTVWDPNLEADEIHSAAMVKYNLWMEG